MEASSVKEEYLRKNLKESDEDDNYSNENSDEASDLPSDIDDEEVLTASNDKKSNTCQISSKALKKEESTKLLKKRKYEISIDEKNDNELVKAENLKSVKKDHHYVKSISRTIIKWNLQNTNNSCRYTAFLTLYRFKLRHIHPDFDNKSKKKGSGWLNMIIKTNEQLDVNSEAIKEFSNYNYNEKYEMDRYGELGSITPLFGAFNILDICHLQVEDKKACHVCTYSAKRNTKSRIGPLFSLDDECLNGREVELFLNTFASSRPWTCESCNNTSDSNCTREITSLPAILFVVLDRTYKDLSNFSDSPENLRFINTQYKLCAVVTKPLWNYFALLIKNPLDDRYENEEISGWYLFNLT